MVALITLFGTQCSIRSPLQRLDVSDYFYCRIQPQGLFTVIINVKKTSVEV